MYTYNWTKDPAVLYQSKQIASFVTLLRNVPLSHELECVNVFYNLLYNYTLN